MKQFEKEYTCEIKIDESGEKTHIFKWKFKGLKFWGTKKNSGVLGFKKNKK